MKKRPAIRLIGDRSSGAIWVDAGLTYGWLWTIRGKAQELDSQTESNFSRSS